MVRQLPNAASQPRSAGPGSWTPRSPCSPSAATTTPRSTTSPARPGVSKALIYEHFASKQELYAELIARNARDLTQRAGAVRCRASRSSRPPSGSPPASRPSSRFVEERRDAWRMLFRDPSDPESAAVLDRMVGAGDRRGDGADRAGPGRARARRAARRDQLAAPPGRDARGRRPSRWPTGGPTTRDAPRAELVEMRDGLRLARARAAQPRRALVGA